METRMCSHTLRCLASCSRVSTRSSGTNQYLRRQATDEFCIKAREHAYRARSAFKLIEMNEKHHFIAPGSTVIDVGAAPGSWCQVLVELLKTKEKSNAYILGIDLQPMAPLPGADLLSLSDITLPSTHLKIKEHLQGRNVDVVLSDMAPNPCGDNKVDHERIVQLCMKTAELFCCKSPVIPLVKGGVYLCKLWDGSRKKEFANYLLQYFETVRTLKPKASRDSSAELYLLAQRFK